MINQTRINLIRDRIHLSRNQRPSRSHKMNRSIPESRKARGRLRHRPEAREMEVRDMHLVTQRKPLEEVEPIWLLRWLLRHYFEWRGFACRSHCGKCDGKCYASIEYRGVFDDDSMAYHAARCRGGAVKPVPFNAALSEETVQYKQGEDAPLSEASPWYRRGVMLPFVSIPRKTIKESVASLRSLEDRLDQLDNCIKGKCVRAL